MADVASVLGKRLLDQESLHLFEAHVVKLRGDLAEEVVVNPKVVIEILSPSTRDYDYGGKYMLYRGLPSVQEYILVEQKTPQIDLYRRTGGHWEIFTYEGLDALLPIESLNISIPLSEIYAG